MKKTIIALTAITLILTVFAGCGREPSASSRGKNGETAPSAPETEAPAPAAPTAESVVGAYVSDRCRIEVSAEDAGTLRFDIRWEANAREHAAWQMSGAFDPETAAVAYDDCVMSDHVLDENGADTAETVYENGTGSFTFADGTLLWTDDTENVAEGMVFLREEAAGN